MGWKIVIQPNGFFAKFSTVCDDFTHCNMDIRETREVCAEEIGTKYIDDKIKEARENPQWFEECIRTVRIVHGREAEAKARMELS